MTEHTPIDAVLDRAEDAVGLDRGLKGTGFWRAVRQVKQDPALVERYADRIARIDRRAFERGVTLRMPASLGLFLLVADSVVGIVLVIVARDYAPKGLAPWLFLAGFAGILVGTHSLTHWIFGRLCGMRFTHVFLGGPPPPRPGVKTDYATYLRASPMQRAVMHASGAVVTKIVPFALAPFSRWPWVTWVLLAIGVVQIFTDIFLSTKVSDWKKVKRELRDRR